MQNISSHKTDKNIFITIIAWLCIAAVVAIIFIISYSASFSVFTWDDFTHANRVGSHHLSFPNNFLSAFGFVKYSYFIFSGSWFSMFLQAVLSPLNGTMFTGLKIIMVLNAALLLISIFYFCMSLFKILFGKLSFSKIIIISSLIFFVITGHYVYTNVYYWFSGAVSYSMPMTLLLCALALFFDFLRTGKKPFFFIATAIGIFSMGGC